MVPEIFPKLRKMLFRFLLQDRAAEGSGRNFSGQYGTVLARGFVSVTGPGSYQVRKSF
jgi:hypothetical protein